MGTQALGENIQNTMYYAYYQPYFNYECIAIYVASCNKFSVYYVSIANQLQ